MTIIPFSDRSALPTDTEYRLWREAADRYRRGRCIHPGCPHKPLSGGHVCGRNACHEFLAMVPDDELETWDGPAPQPLTVLVAMTRRELAAYSAVVALVSGAVVMALYTAGMRYGWLL